MKLVFKKRKKKYSTNLHYTFVVPVSIFFNKKEQY